jgi:hypothetical protein
MIINDLDFGASFLYNNIPYIITQDRDRNNRRLSISLKDGSSRWIKDDIEVQLLDLYTIDDNNNFTPLKERKSELAKN